MKIYLILFAGFLLTVNFAYTQPANEKIPADNYNEKNYKKKQQEINTFLTSEYKRERTVIKIRSKLYKYDYFNSIMEILKDPEINIINEKNKVESITSNDKYLYVIDISARKKYTRKIPLSWCFLKCD
jgi:hypothetical protein